MKQRYKLHFLVKSGKRSRISVKAFKNNFVPTEVVCEEPEREKQGRKEPTPGSAQRSSTVLEGKEHHVKDVGEENFSLLPF